MPPHTHVARARSREEAVEEVGLRRRLDGGGRRVRRRARPHPGLLRADDLLLLLLLFRRRRRRFALVREAAEAEEKLFYEERAPKEWLEDLAPLGTDWQKPFLTTAPWLIVVFKEIYGQDENGSKNKHYYVNESVGIASGFLITAIHQLGLATLTHTPSPMNFLSEILERPENEKPFLLLPVGYPQDEMFVPHISKKGLNDISKFYM